MKRRVFGWVILGMAIGCLAYGWQRKHTIKTAAPAPDAEATVEEISDAELVVFATNGGAKRSSDGLLAKVVAENGESPKACPT